MKKNQHTTIVLSVLMILFACGNKQTNQVVVVAQEMIAKIDSINDHTEYNPSAEYDESEKRLQAYLAEAVSCIANGDKEGFASHCVYPIKRKSPLPSIEDSAAMVKYFDILFDDSIKQSFKTATKDDWGKMGCNGFMFRNGELWDGYFDDGINCINLFSANERALWKKTWNEELAQLHPSLRGNWIRDHFFKCPNGYVVRIDAHYKNIDDYDSDTLRVSIFFDGQYKNKKPDILLYGKVEVLGSAGNRDYSFKDKNYAVQFRYYYATSRDCSPFEFNLEGKKKYHTTAIKFLE